MKKQAQSSIWDNLIRIMPEFADKVKKSPNYVDPITARSLYNVWRTGEKKAQKVYKKPVTLGHEEQRRMADSGLIKAIGENIEITEKGAKVINVMLLGDDRSIFEDDGKAVDYSTALNNTKGIKTAKQLKVASKQEKEEPKNINREKSSYDSWWSRFTK